MRLNLINSVSLCAAFMMAGCSAYPTQAYYQGRHTTPREAGYVSAPYYTHGRTKQYVSSYPTEYSEMGTNSPYQRQYVSAQGHAPPQFQSHPQPYEVYGQGTSPEARDTYMLQQWGFVHHRTVGQNSYFILRNVNHQISLERAIETVPNGQTVELGQTTHAPTGYPLLFTPNSPLYRTSRTGEACREVFLERVDRKPLRGIFCSQDNVPWGLIR